MAANQSKKNVAGPSTRHVSLFLDVLVTGVVALTGTAVALGLYLQAGFGFVPALSVGAGLFVWLLSAHFLITRMRLKRVIDEQLNSLSKDVSHLKKETEITDLLAEGHNELLTGQNALENAIGVIVKRMDQYDHRLKVLYKLGKEKKDQLSKQDLADQEQRLSDIEGDLVRLSAHIDRVEGQVDENSRQQLYLVKAELDVLELIVQKFDVVLPATDQQGQSAPFAQKALTVIEGLKRLPIMKQIDGDDGIPTHLSLPEFTFKANELEQPKNTDISKTTLEAPKSQEKSEKNLPEPTATETKNEEKTSLSQEALLVAVNEAIQDNRIELYMQPIVSLPERELVFYEAFSRLRNELGQLLLPRDFVSIADMAGLMPLIDNQMILRTVQVIERLVSRGKGKVVFCNLSMSSLRDADFFAEFMDFMEANKWLSAHLAFEFSQESVEAMEPYDYERLKAIADLGFRFSMDHIERLDIDFKALAQMNFAYIKLNSSLLLGNAGNLGAEIHPADLDPYLNRLNITMIVDQIERESIVRQLRDYNVNYAQGLLFCEPKPVRPEVFEQQAADVA